MKPASWRHKQSDDSLAGATPYTHKPLESISHIRVLELLPGSPESSHPPECRIQHVDIGTPGLTYMALSYTWGDTSPHLRRPIRVDDDNVLMVTPSLHACLCRLRTDKGSIVLWADAICINQADDDSALKERAVQVGLMRHIFSAAEEVAIGLGAMSGEDADILIAGFNLISSIEIATWNRILAEAEKNYKHHLSSPFIMTKTFKEKQSYYNSITSLLAPLGLPHCTDPLWQAFRKLTCQPWFQRIWTIQELALAKRAYFMLGKHAIPAEDFQRGTQRASDYLDIMKWHTSMYSSRVRYYWHSARISSAYAFAVIKLFYSGFKSPPQEPNKEWVQHNALRVSLFSTRRYGQQRANDAASWTQMVDDPSFPNPLAVSRLFLEYCHWECTDPRDRLYGLLGLADDGAAAELYIDYQEDTPTVSRRFSKYLVEHELEGFVLYYADYAGSDTPSWAINLVNPSPFHGYLQLCQLSSNDHGNGLFRAAGASTFSFSFSAGGKHLETRVILLGSVASQTDPFPIEAFGDSNRFLNLLWLWSNGASIWISQVSKARQVDSVVFRTSCLRAMYCDLRDDDNGSYSRLGNSEEAMHRIRSLEVFFPLAETHKEIGTYMRKNLGQRIQDLKTFGPFSTLLSTTMPGRRIGLALHVGDQYNHFNIKNPPTVGSPSQPEGWVCQLPQETEIGDEVAIINGCQIPFVLRRDQHTGTFRIVGTCYVSQMMDGDEDELRRWPRCQIVLV